MQSLITLLTEMITTVVGSLIHNWLPLSLADAGGGCYDRVH